MEEKFLKTKLISSTIWKFMERIAAQLVSFVVSIILARLLSPEDYSSVSLIIVFFAFANILISGGFTSALIQKKNSDNLDYSTILVFSITVSIGLYLILFILAPKIADIYHRSDLCAIIRVMSITLPITAVKSLWCAYISSRMLFRKFFFATIGGTLVSALVGIIMAYKGLGAWSLVAQNMTNTAVDTIILILSTHIYIGFKFSFNRFRNLFKYSWKILVSSLIGTTYSQIVPLFIGIKYSNQDLAFYTKGRSFPELISSTTTYTLSAVLFPFLSHFQDRKDKLLEYTRLYIRFSSFFAFPLMLGMYAVSENFVLVVLTEKWINAIHYIKIFCIANMFEMVHVGNCETIKAMGRSDIFLKIEIIKKLGYFTIIGFFLYFTNKPQELAFAFIVCTFFALIVNSMPNRYLIGYSYKNQIIDLLPNLISSFFMLVFVKILGNWLPKGTAFSLIIQVLLGVLGYIIICIASKNRSLFSLYSMIKKRK